MPVQSSSVPTVTLPSITLKNLLDSNSGLMIENETHKQENRVKDLALEVLKDEKTELKRELKNEKIEKKRLTQLADEGLQSSKRVLQYVCAIAGALLSGGLVLAFPPTSCYCFYWSRTSGSWNGTCWWSYWWMHYCSFCSRKNK